MSQVPLGMAMMSTKDAGCAPDKGLMRILRLLRLYQYWMMRKLVRLQNFSVSVMVSVVTPSSVVRV